jgi:hypothetical protein
MHSADNRADAQWEIPIMLLPDGRRIAFLIIFNVPGVLADVERWDELEEIIKTWCADVSKVLVNTQLKAITECFDIREISIK